jgi:hypothetical protein
MQLEIGKSYKTISGEIVLIDRKGRKYYKGTITKTKVETNWWPNGVHTISARLKIVEEIDPGTLNVLKDITILWKK